MINFDTFELLINVNVTESSVGFFFFLVNAASNGTCNSAQQAQSNDLSDSLENTMKLLFSDRRKNLVAIKLIKINEVLDRNDSMLRNME